MAEISHEPTHIALKEITKKIGSGATPEGGKESYKDEGISLIRSLNVHDFRFVHKDLAFINDAQADGLSNVIVEPRDILLNITGASVARCCMVPNKILPARVNQHVAIVRINWELADPYYIMCCLNSPYYKECLLGIAQGGATREALTKEKIENFSIPLPHLPTQHKIAAILSAYDDLIENNLRRIKILEEMAQNLYREWFVKFRFPGHESVRFVDSAIGRIPEGWGIRDIYDTAYITYGFAFKSNEFNTAGIGKPVIRIRDILAGISNTYSTQKTGHKYIVQNGDILVGMDGDFHMGFWSGGEAYLVQRVARFRPKEGISRYYLFFAIKQPIEQFNATITGTTVAHLGDKHIRTIPITWPLPNILEEARQNLEPILELILNLRLKNQTLFRTRDLLLPKLISGEMDVSEMDITIPEDFT